MASYEEGEPAISSTKLRLPLSMLDDLRSLKSGENVSISYSDSTNINATVTSDNMLEIDIATEKNIDSGSGHGRRRSQRRHKGKSALELLGISPRKTTKTSPLDVEKSREKTASKGAKTKTGSPEAGLSDKCSSKVNPAKNQNETVATRQSRRLISLKKKIDNKKSNHTRADKDITKKSQTRLVQICAGEHQYASKPVEFESEAAKQQNGELTKAVNDHHDAADSSQNSSVSKQQDSVSDKNVSVSDKNVSVSDKNVSLKDNVSVRKKVVSIHDKNVSVRDKDVSVSDNVVSVSDKVVYSGSPGEGHKAGVTEVGGLVSQGIMSTNEGQVVSKSEVQSSKTEGHSGGDQWVQVENINLQIIDRSDQATSTIAKPAAMNEVGGLVSQGIMLTNEGQVVSKSEVQSSKTEGHSGGDQWVQVENINLQIIDRSDQATSTIAKPAAMNVVLLNEDGTTLCTISSAVSSDAGDHGDVNVEQLTPVLESRSSEGQAVIAGRENQQVSIGGGAEECDRGQELTGTVLHIQETDGSTAETTIQMLQVVEAETAVNLTEQNDIHMHLLGSDEATQEAVATLIKLEDAIVSSVADTGTGQLSVPPPSFKVSRENSQITGGGQNVIDVQVAKLIPAKRKRSGTITRISKRQRKDRDQPQAVELSEEFQAMIDGLTPTEDVEDHFNVVKTKQTSKTFHCNYCEGEVIFKTKAEALTHLVKHHKHKDFKPWKCPMCEYRGLLRSHVTRHINVHSSQKPYKCTLCGRRFTFRQKLNIHMKYHRDERDHQCKFCGMAFHEYKTLKNHIKRIHSSNEDVGHLKEFLHGKKGRSTLLGTQKTQKLTDQFRKTREATEKESDTQQTSEVSQSKVIKANKKRKKTDVRIEKELLNFIETVMDSTYGSRPVYQCKVCGERFPNKTKVINHLESQHKELKIWKCMHCDYRSRVRSNLMVHIKLHTGIKDHVCGICGKCFAFKQKLEGHMKFHLNKREYVCDLCNRGFNHKNDLSKHKIRVHTTERPETCEVCGKSYKDKVMLKRHMESHAETKQYLCEVCKKYYMTRQSLQQHMKSHTCMFHCEICDKNFGSYSGFMAHKVMHDESYSGYVCPQCSKVLHTKGSLQRHIKVSHGTEREYKCTSCEKSFKTSKDLKNHQIVHDEDKPYQCDYCGYTSKRLESLRVHMRRHESIKPFQCGICKKQYTQKHALEVHLRFHEGQVAGQCSSCNRTFTNKHQLKLHMEKKHPEISSDENTSFTVFMCEECNSVFLNQDSLAVHILAEHMKHSNAESVGKTTTIDQMPEVNLSVIENSTSGDLENVSNMVSILSGNHLAVVETQTSDEVSGMELNISDAICMSDGQSYVAVAETIEIPIDQQAIEIETVQEAMEI